MVPSGLLREVVVIEEAVTTRNDVGEMVQSQWREVCRRRAAISQQSGDESQQMHQANATATYEVRMHYTPQVRTGMRLRWESRQDRLLYVSSVLEVGNRAEHRLYAEERE